MLGSVSKMYFQYVLLDTKDQGHQLLFVHFCSTSGEKEVVLFSVCSAGHEGTWVAGGGGCTACAAGKFNAAPDGTCTLCNAGQSSAAGATSCVDCLADTYSENPGDPCQPCGNGATTDRATGQTGCGE